MNLHCLINYAYIGTKVSNFFLNAIFRLHMQGPIPNPGLGRIDSLVFVDFYTFLDFFYLFQILGTKILVLLPKLGKQNSSEVPEGVNQVRAILKPFSHEFEFSYEFLTNFVHTIYRTNKRFVAAFIPIRRNQRFVHHN